MQLNPNSAVILELRCVSTMTVFVLFAGRFRGRCYESDVCVDAILTLSTVMLGFHIILFQVVDYIFSLPCIPIDQKEAAES